MVAPSSPFAGSWLQVLRSKRDFLRSGGRDELNSHQIGLTPAPGWRKRNWSFFRRVLLPSLVHLRGGEFRWPSLESPREGENSVTWIGHSSFLIQGAFQNILFDPVWALWLSVLKRARRPGLAISALPPIDVVLISHAHYDHMHLPSLAAVANGQPIIVPPGVGGLVRRHRLAFSPIIELDWWEETTMGDLKITATPARHWGARYVHDGHRGFGGYVIETPHSCFYHCGDSAYFEGFREIGERFAIDLALLPIGAYNAPSGRDVHMNPEQALDAFVDLGATEMAPMHYGTFPLGGEPLYEPLERLVFEAGSRALSHRVRILEEGIPETFSRESLAMPS